METENLTQIIDQVAQQNNLSKETVEKRIIDFLDQEYFNGHLFEEQLVRSGKNKILRLLYSAQGQKIGSGYWGWNVPSYKDLLYQFGHLDAAERMYFERVCDELLADELIYTHAYTGDKQPTTVGLTAKGILFFAAQNRVN